MNANEAPALARDQLQVVWKMARRTLRHAWWGALAAALGIAATVAFVRLKPNHYTSEAVLHYEPGIQWDASSESPRYVGQRLKDTILSRRRLHDIVREFRLYPTMVDSGRAEDAVEEMRKVIAFRMSDGGTFTIAFTADSPEEARRVTERLTELAVSENQQSRSEQVEVTKDFIEGERKRTEDQLRAKEADLAKFLTAHPEFLQDVRRVPETAPAAGIDEPEVARGVTRAPAAAPATDPLASLRAAERQTSAELDAARREAELQRSRFTDKHPSVAAASEVFKEAEQRHDRALEALRAAERTQPSPIGPETPKSAGKKLARAAPRPRPSPAAMAEAETEYARLTRLVGEERDRLQKLDARQFVANMAASSYTTGNGARIRLIDPAYAPSQPTGTRPTLLLLIGIAASLAFGGAVALGLAFVDDRVYDRQDVERLKIAPFVVEVLQLRKAAASAGGDPRSGGIIVDAWQPTRFALPGPGTVKDGRRSPRWLLPPKSTKTATETDDGGAPVPVFAEAFVGDGDEADPHVPNFTIPSSTVPGTGPAPGADTASPAGHVHVPPGAANEAASSLVAASFRVLRHRLNERRGVRTVLVTSPTAGEGKTTCALNLALAMCECGRARVLLVDANLQRPAIGRLLGLERRDLPRGSHPGQRWSSVEPVTPWLHVATPATGAPTSFVDALSVQLGLEELGARDYDEVIIDGPPVLGAADVNLFEPAVDAILLTTWARRSHASMLRDAAKQIGSPKVLGVVVMC
jgi:Mrp family chromosome partitioning ATPase/uncharacterized protein involved in exopolysaccharide biosynthesis